VRRSKKPPNRRLQLATLRNPKCEACALCNSSVNVCVMGRGNPRAKIVLIGEAPGAKEAETGKPFMGASGRLLGDCLLRAGLGEDEYYVTNINKCRPPGNRTPTADEQAVCTELYLAEELAIIRPYVVVLIGGTAAKWAFPSGYIRGSVNPSEGLVAGSVVACVPTWHPAYYLHSGDQSIPGLITKHLRLARRTRDAVAKQIAEAKRSIHDPDN
jgi:uracil-DNA glycosylase family 4